MGIFPSGMCLSQVSRFQSAIDYERFFHTPFKMGTIIHYHSPITIGRPESNEMKIFLERNYSPNGSETFRSPQKFINQFQLIILHTFLSQSLKFRFSYLLNVFYQ